MTLLEVLAAVAIAGFVILAGVLLLDSVNDATARIATDAFTSTREGNGARLLAQLLRDAAPSADTSMHFRGDERSIELTTRCGKPEGWRTPCRVVLAIDSTADSARVIAALETGEQLTLRTFRGAAHWRYFDHARDTTWATTWNTNATLPTALGLLAGGDTIVLPVGPSRE